MRKPEKNTLLNPEQKKLKIYHKIDKAIEDLFVQVEIETFKEKFDTMLIGWISSGYIESMSSSERSNLYYCIITIIRFVEQSHKSIDSEALIKLSLAFVDYDYCEKSINIALRSFLTTEEADDNNVRTALLTYTDCVLTYLKKIFNLTDKLNKAA